MLKPLLLFTLLLCHSYPAYVQTAYKVVDSLVLTPAVPFSSPDVFPTPDGWLILDQNMILLYNRSGSVIREVSHADQLFGTRVTPNDMLIIDYNYWIFDYPSHFYVFSREGEFLWEHSFKFPHADHKYYQVTDGGEQDFFIQPLSGKYIIGLLRYLRTYTPELDYMAYKQSILCSSVWGRFTLSRSGRKLKAEAMYGNHPSDLQTVPLLAGSQAHVTPAGDTAFYLSFDQSEKVYHLSVSGDTLNTFGVPGDSIRSGLEMPVFHTLKNEVDSLPWYYATANIYREIYKDPYSDYLYRIYKPSIHSPVIDSLQENGPTYDLILMNYTRPSYLQIYDTGASFNRILDVPVFPCFEIVASEADGLWVKGCTLEGSKSLVLYKLRFL